MTEREILFRGKRTDNEKWVEGIYCPYNWDLLFKRLKRPQIIILSDNKKVDGFWCDVIPETVGQYTGLTDKNGVKIFEGDILAARFDEDFPENITIVQVVWNEYGWCIKQGSLVPDPLEESDGDLFEVIGNIYDNPDMLERRC